MKNAVLVVALLGVFGLAGCTSFGAKDSRYTAYATAVKASSETQTECVRALGEAAKAGKESAIMALAVGTCARGAQVSAPQEEQSNALGWASLVLQAFGIHTNGVVSMHQSDNQTKQALSNDDVVKALGLKDPVIVQPATPVIVPTPAPLIVNPVIVPATPPLIVNPVVIPPTPPVIVPPSYPPQVTLPASVQLWDNVDEVK